MERTTKARVAFAWFLTCVSLCAHGAVADDDDPSPQTNQYRTARSFDFGAFCISNIPVGAVTSVSRPDLLLDGAWREVVIKIPPISAGIAHVYFLGGITQPSGRDSACVDVLPVGVRRIAEGDIASGTIRFRVLEPIAPYSRALEIRDSDLDIVVSRTNLQLDPLFGGTVAIDKHDLHIKNIGVFVSNPGRTTEPRTPQLSGHLLIGSTQLRVRGALLGVPGASQRIKTDLAAAGTGVALDVQIPTGETRLRQGRFSATAVVLPPDTYLVGGVTIASSAARAGSVQIYKDDPDGTLPRLQFNDVRLNATALTRQSPPVASLMPQGATTMARLDGPLKAFVDSAEMESPVATDIRIATARMKLGGTPERPRMAGDGPVAIQTLADSGVVAQASLSNPDMSGFKSAMKNIVTRSMKLTINGPWETADVSGEIDPSLLDAGPISLQNLSRALTRFAGRLSAATEFGIKVAIDAPSAVGRWSMMDASGQTIVIEGGVTKLRIDGVLWLSSDDSTSRLQINPNGLQIAASATAVRQPLIFGAPADQTTVGGSVTLSSSEGFVVSKTDTSGKVEISAAALSVARGAALSFNNESKGQFTIQVPVRFDAGVEVALDLKTNAVTLRSGNLALENLVVEAISGDPFQVAGLRITAPKLAIGRIVVTATEQDATVTITGFDTSATSISHPDPPKLDADASKAHFDSLRAKLGAINSSLALVSIGIDGLNLSADKGGYRSEEGFTIRGSTFRMTAKSLTQDTVDTGQITVASGAVKLAVADAGLGESTTAATDFDSFSLSATGTKNDLTGDGHLHLTNLQIDHRFPLIPEKCGEAVKVHASIGVGAVDLALHMQHGKLDGVVQASNSSVSLNDTGEQSCEWNENYNINVIQTVTQTVCWVPLISEICKEVQKRVNVSVTVGVKWKFTLSSLDVPGSIDTVSVRVKGTDGVFLCVSGVKMNAAGHVPLFTVAPTINASGDIAKAVKSAVDAAFKLSFGTFESALATLIVNMTSLITNLFPVAFCA
jgi:hypothetical protein